MKKIKWFKPVLILIMLLALSVCLDRTEEDVIEPSPKNSGEIYLFGELHSIEKILDKELALWHEYYHDNNMRHLFIEGPYYTAAFLNIWMQSEGDEILEDIYDDWIGTLSHSPHTKEFYKKIKINYPETIFHGTDVGHQYHTTGERFLRYLENNNLEGSQQYLLAQEAIEQGKHYYKDYDNVYRENKMAENFIREFDSLKDESIMGIYGGAHTGLDAMDYSTGSVPCMANQLKAHYGDSVYSESIVWYEPYRVDVITINEKSYEASYFGKEDLTGWSKDYTYREFWRLENAYDDFKDSPKTGNVLPYNNYSILIEAGQVFIIDYAKKDGSVIRQYHRSDGYIWNNMISTEEFTVE